MICVSLAVAASAQTRTRSKAAGHPQTKTHLAQAYFDGVPLEVHTGPYQRGERTLIVGDWNLGPRVGSKPSDKRSNLYFVIPGTQHEQEGRLEYDKTAILSFAPDEPHEFDVFWAVVLDPTLQEHFTSEPQLILATQQTFTPNQDFQFRNIPSAKFLASHLKISSLEKLDKYRRPDGTLPRVAIITAGFAIRLSVDKPDENQAEQPPKQAEQPVPAPQP